MWYVESRCSFWIMLNHDGRTCYMLNYVMWNVESCWIMLNDWSTCDIYNEWLKNMWYLYWIIEEHKIGWIMLNQQEHLICWIMLNRHGRTCDMVNHDELTCDMLNHDGRNLLKMIKTCGIENLIVNFKIGISVSVWMS